MAGSVTVLSGIPRIKVCIVGYGCAPKSATAHTHDRYR